MKARIKDFANMPDNSKCCDISNSLMKNFCGSIVELIPKPRMTSSTCPYCGVTEKGIGFLIRDQPFSLRADMVDIDEGEIN